MKEIASLLDIADQLLGDRGCPWDKEQTLLTLQPYLLEEMHELIEAIDSSNAQKMTEELGDVLYLLVFVAKVAEAKGLFVFSDAVQVVAEKMVRRHPHVFGDVQVNSPDDVVKNWEEIKKKEKAQADRKKLFDGIPPTLPMLARAQKMVKILRKHGTLTAATEKSSVTEEEMGEQLWQLVVEAEDRGIDIESAFRRKLRDYL